MLRPYSAYLRLSRLHQRAGIWLLLWPCWWSVALASPGLPPPRLLALFALGAICMRSAGCIINDLWDRDIDRQVERTKDRPLASGELGMAQAGLLLTFLLSMSLAIACALGMKVVGWAALSLPLVVTYPLMKRITWWPQLFLGFTFNWGALLGWVAVKGSLGWPAVALYAGGIFWTLGYDTLYAHQDKADDARIGVKSTALRLGAQSKRSVGLFYLAAVLCWAASGLMASEGLLLFPLLLLAQLQLSWQVCRVNLDDPASCKRMFASNVWLGWLILMGMIAGKFA